MKLSWTLYRIPRKLNKLVFYEFVDNANELD